MFTLVFLLFLFNYDTSIIIIIEFLLFLFNYDTSIIVDVKLNFIVDFCYFDIYYYDTGIIVEQK